MALYFAPRQLRLWIVTLLHFVFACLILAETAPSCEGKFLVHLMCVYILKL